MNGWLIVAIIFLVIMTVLGSLLYILHDYKKHIDFPIDTRIFYYIMCTIMGAPYLVMRMATALIDEIQTGRR